MVFHWSLSDSKSPQASTTLFSILAVLTIIIIIIIIIIIAVVCGAFSHRCVNGLMKRFNRLIGQVVGVFANGPGEVGSIPDRIIPKIFRMVLDISLLNTQQYKVCIKGKEKQSRKRTSALPYTSV